VYNSRTSSCTHCIAVGCCLTWTTTVRHQSTLMDNVHTVSNLVYNKAHSLLLLFLYTVYTNEHTFIYCIHQCTYIYILYTTMYILLLVIYCIHQCTYIYILYTTMHILLYTVYTNVHTFKYYIQLCTYSHILYTIMHKKMYIYKKLYIYI